MTVLSLLNGEGVIVNNSKLNMGNEPTPRLDSLQLT
nr:MAG TPA: hypothetical protein [Caudoviricetes sp.]